MDKLEVSYKSWTLNSGKKFLFQKKNNVATS